MGIKKKHFFYELDQYTDKNRKLLFLIKTIPLSSSGFVYLFTDCYLNEVVYLDISELKKVQLAFKDVVNLTCEFFDFSHRRPLGFLEKTRNGVLFLCLKFSYLGVSEKSKPTAQNLADIFKMYVPNVIRMAKKHESGTSKDAEWRELTEVVAKLASCALN